MSDTSKLSTSTSIKVDTQTIQQAVTCIKQGSVIAYPTEAVFGIGCCALNEKALIKTRSIKKRSDHKGFIVLCASVEQMLNSFPDLLISEAQKATLTSEQNHPTTWIIDSATIFSKALQGENKSLAIRVTQHPVAKSLCEKAGPITSTSANQEGEAPALDISTIQETFSDKIAYYLNGELGNATSPSQIIHLNSGKIIRSA